MIITPHDVRRVGAARGHVTWEIVELILDVDWITAAVMGGERGRERGGEGGKRGVRRE